MEKLTVDPCPVCGFVLDEVVCLTEGANRGPEPGDYTICLGCYNLLAFGHNRSLLVPTEEQVEELKTRNASVYKDLMNVRRVAKLMEMQKAFEDKLGKLSSTK